MVIIIVLGAAAASTGRFGLEHDDLIWNGRILSDPFFLRHRIRGGGSAAGELEKGEFNLRCPQLWECGGGFLVETKRHEEMRVEDDGGVPGMIKLSVSTLI
jgi:hypothetical protein